MRFGAVRWSCLRLARPCSSPPLAPAGLQLQPPCHTLPVCLQTVADAYSVTATFSLHNKPVSPLWEWSKVPEVAVTARAFLPSTSVISFTLGNGLVRQGGYAVG